LLAESKAQRTEAVDDLRIRLDQASAEIAALRRRADDAEKALVAARAQADAEARALEQARAEKAALWERLEDAGKELLGKDAALASAHGLQAQLKQAQSHLSAGKEAAAAQKDLLPQLLEARSALADEKARADALGKDAKQAAKEAKESKADALDAKRKLAEREAELKLRTDSLSLSQERLAAELKRADLLKDTVETLRAKDRAKADGDGEFVLRASELGESAEIEALRQTITELRAKLVDAEHRQAILESSVPPLDRGESEALRLQLERQTARAKELVAELARAHETIEALETELAEAETHLRNLLSKQPSAAATASTPLAAASPAVSAGGGEACAQKCARLAAELERATAEFASRLFAEQVRTPASSVTVRRATFMLHASRMRVFRWASRPFGASLHAPLVPCRAVPCRGQRTIRPLARSHICASDAPRVRVAASATRPGLKRGGSDATGQGTAWHRAKRGLCRPRTRGCAMSSRG
jgi:chromosome segregation ATPase